MAFTETLSRFDYISREVSRCLRFADKLNIVRDSWGPEPQISIKVGTEEGFISYEAMAAAESPQHLPYLLDALWALEENLFDKNLDKNLVALSTPLC